MPRITIVPIDGSLGPRARASVERVPLDLEVADVGQATGNHLLFLGAEDVLVTSGLLALVSAIDASGSDAAAGTAATGGTSEPLRATSVKATPALL